jgi:hypothetical protein
MIIGKAEVETALREVPFTIRMADGRDYRVKDPRQVVVGPKHIVYVDDVFVPHMLPYLTITALSYEPNKKGAEKKPRKKG